MINILGTGLTGLVGSRIVELLSDRYSFENLSLETGVDITQKDVVNERIRLSRASWVFHFAAYTDVDKAEEEKNKKMESTSWLVNVEATKNIVETCQAFNKRLLYVSTDFVFDGKSKETYDENDVPHPLGWYAITKFEAENLVMSLKDKALIVRISFPYCNSNQHKKDFVHKIIERLQRNERVNACSDQIIVPTLIDDIALAIDMLLSNNASGIVHVVGSQSLTPLEIAMKIARKFMYNESLIYPMIFSQYYQNRAPRPFHAILSNDKISKFGVHMSTFDEGLKKIA